jgi:hypothetical protein
MLVDIDYNDDEDDPKDEPAVNSINSFLILFRRSLQ